MKSQMSFEIDKIITLVLVALFVVWVVPVAVHLSQRIQDLGCKEYLDKVNELTKEKQQIEMKLNEKESEILKLQSLLSLLNMSLSEKDKLISNLTLELQGVKRENEILKKEIIYYEEKKYVTEIHNYLFNISSQLTEIKNNLYLNFWVGFSVGLISFTIINIVFKLKPLALRIIKDIIVRFDRRAEKEKPSI